MTQSTKKHNDRNYRENGVVMLVSRPMTAATTATTTPAAAARVGTLEIISHGIKKTMTNDDKHDNNRQRDSKSKSKFWLLQGKPKASSASNTNIMASTVVTVMLIDGFSNSQSNRIRNRNARTALAHSTQEQ